MGELSGFDELDARVEACCADERAIKQLRPSTLEGCVVRVSDMIAYVGKDRQDALDMGVLPSLDVFDSAVIGRDNARIINNITVDIVNNSYRKERICMSEAVFADLKRAKQQNYDLIYLKEGMWPTPATWWRRCSRTCTRAFWTTFCTATSPRRSSVTMPRRSPRSRAACP